MRLRIVLSVLLGSVLLSGCGPTLADVPLPGNGVGADTVTVKIPFDEALNLAQGAPVKVNGVTAGKVRAVTTRDFKALAVVEVRRDAKMRTTATARLRYTTPLGELFVDVHNPDRGPLLHDGQQLDPRRASTAPTVEDTLAQASLLINGGGLGQLQVVTEELNNALGGREATVREVLSRTRDLIAAANGSTPDLTRALDAMARLSRTLHHNDATVDAALRDLRPAATVLRQETPALTRLLRVTDRFATSADQLVTATRADLLTMLGQLSPILEEFLANRGTLGPSLRALSAASNLLDGIFPGDYWNLLARLELDGAGVPDLLGGSTDGNPRPVSPAGGSGSSGEDPLGGLLGGLLGGRR